MTTVLGGLTGTVAVLPLSGSGVTNGVTPIGNSIDGAGQDFAAGQPLARNATITSVAASASLRNAMALIGTTVTLQAQVYSATAGSNVFTAIPGASVTMAPGLTGILAIGTTTEGITTGLSIPVASQTRLILVISATSAGISLINSVSASVSTGVAMS